MDIGLIAIDVDGTLVPALDVPVSQRNREAIRKATERGISVCLLSGRVYPSMKSRAVECGANGPLAACNGAYIRWKGKELCCRHIHRDALLRCATLIQDAGLFFHVWTRDGGYCVSQNYNAERYARMNASIPNEFKISMQVFEDAAKLAETVGSGALKMTILEQDTMKLAMLRPLLQKAAAPEAYVTSSESFNLEVIDKHVSKGWALETMAKACGVPMENTLAIGNSYNDIPMFLAAGISVAVADADEEVLHRVHHISGTCEKDGVAEAIEQYALPGGRSRSFQSPS